VTDGRRSGPLSLLSPRRAEPVLLVLQHVGAVFLLFRQTLYFSFVAPLRGRSKLRKQLFPMMSNVGVRSLPIVSLVSLLTGGILVLQTGDIIRQYGQLDRLPVLVTLSMTRAMGPLMTAIILTARVGASYTAVLASMKINDEVLALETMAIHPVGFLVAPRFLSMVVMLPCLTLAAYLLGMIGGGLVATGKYGMAFAFYVDRTFDTLTVTELLAGLSKAFVYSVLISMTCCYFGLKTKGGPTGLGRNTMIAVVTSLVVVIIADALLTAFLVNYVY
jgi:phospholipid/cholesterol/gamma-HCH transport system permease protein